MQAATCTYLLTSSRPAGGRSLLPHSSDFKERGKQETVQMLRYIQKSHDQTLSDSLGVCVCARVRVLTC